MTYGCSTMFTVARLAAFTNGGAGWKAYADKPVGYGACGGDNG